MLFRYNDTLEKRSALTLSISIRVGTVRLHIIVKHATTFLIKQQSIWSFLTLLGHDLELPNNQQYLIISCKVNCLIHFGNFDILVFDGTKFRLLTKVN